MICFSHGCHLDPLYNVRLIHEIMFVWAKPSVSKRKFNIDSSGYEADDCVDIWVKYLNVSKH